MKITILKKCLLLSGVQKKGATLVVNDALAKSLIASGVAKEVSTSEVEKPAQEPQDVENKAEQPEEMK